jgi:hypothetical protein
MNVCLNFIARICRSALFDRLNYLNSQRGVGVGEIRHELEPSATSAKLNKENFPFKLLSQTSWNLDQSICTDFIKSCFHSSCCPKRVGTWQNPLQVSAFLLVIFLFPFKLLSQASWNMRAFSACSIVRPTFHSSCCPKRVGTVKVARMKKSVAVLSIQVVVPSELEPAFPAVTTIWYHSFHSSCCPKRVGTPPLFNPYCVRFPE